MNNTNEQKYTEFMWKEAKWLDSMVRPYIPRWMQWIVEKNNQNIIGRLGHFLVDYVWISRVQKITIKRNQDTVQVGGKGFRPGHNQQKLVSVRTTITRRGKEIATEKFPVNIIIK